MVLAALVLLLEGETPPEPVGLRGFFYGLLREVAPEVHDQGENPFALGFGRAKAFAGGEGEDG